MATEYGSDANKQAGAGFLLGMLVSQDVFSAWMSSPWSTETFSTDEVKRERARRLIAKSLVQAVGAGAIAAWLTAQIWYLVGVAFGGGMLCWEYYAGLKRAEDAEGQG